MKKATAYANANIALIKYWGKNDHPLNIPAVSSLSMTLDGFGTIVTVTANESNEHVLIIEKEVANQSDTVRVSLYLEQIRTLFPYQGFLRIASTSVVPLAGGLASSAAFFAALAIALDHYLDLNLDRCELSKVARIGSGSAARSIFSGIAGLYGGPSIGHDEAHAFPLQSHPDLDLAMTICVVDRKSKPISSRSAMNRTKNTSPFFQAFIDSHTNDFHGAKAAVRDGSFETLGSLMEHSTLKMFATMWSALPAVNYWHPQSLALINLVYQLRKDHGPIAYFTMDAGPNVKILSRSSMEPLIKNAVELSGFALEIKTCTFGQGAYALDTHVL